MPEQNIAFGQRLQVSWQAAIARRRYRLSNYANHVFHTEVDPPFADYAWRNQPT